MDIPLPKHDTPDIYDYGFDKYLNRNIYKQVDRNPLVYNPISDTLDPSNIRFGSLSTAGSQSSLPIASTKAAFGGDGSDGVLSITSGTTTLSFASANTLVKHYKSLEISGTGALTFSNPAAGGSTAYFKVQGDVTITSTTVPAIDLRSFGATAGGGGAQSGGTQAGSGGGGGGSAANKGSVGGNSGGGAGGQNPGTTGTDGPLIGISGGGIGGDSSITSGGGGLGVGGPGGTSPQYNSNSVFYIRLPITPGGGGGGGGGGPVNGGTSGAGAAGGRGAGSILIECGGRLKITSTINAAGTAGSGLNATPAPNGGAGGGGGSGSIIIVYNQLISNTGTYTVTGGSGGTTNGSGGGGGAGAAGLSAIVQNNSFL